MQLIDAQSKKMGSAIRIAGPPLALLAILLSLEAVFGLLGLQVHYVEAWLILVIVPLALLFTQGSKAHKASTKKIMCHPQWIWIYVGVSLVTALSIWQVTAIVRFTVQGSVAVVKGTKSAKITNIIDSIGKTSLSRNWSRKDNRFLHLDRDLEMRRNDPVSKTMNRKHDKPTTKHNATHIEALNSKLKGLNVAMQSESRNRSAVVSTTLKKPEERLNSKDLRSKLKRLNEIMENQMMKSRPVKLLTDVSRYGHELWIKALSAKFHSYDLYRGRIGGGRALEQKLTLADEVRKLQDKQGCYGGPAIIPRTLPLRNQTERQFFCERVAAVCGHQESLWVTKPKKSAFGIGVNVHNLTGHDAAACLVALSKLDSDPHTAPHLAQEFLGEPLTVHGDKVELRFHVLIASIRPYVVLYHPDFIVKKVEKSFKKTAFDGFNVNSHVKGQNVVSFTPEELVRALSLDHQALELIRIQLERITRLVVTAHYQAKGFERDEKLGNPDLWEIYGCDVALTKDLRAYLLDWNFNPGLGFNVNGAASQRASTIRDMYGIVLQKFKDASAQNLAAFASQTSWKLVIDETGGRDAAFPDCSGGDWQTDLKSNTELVQSWAAKDAQINCD